MKRTPSDKIARLYQLVAEMRRIINELRDFEIEVRITGYPSSADPLGQEARLIVTLKPGCEYLR